ncbi:MAG: M20/M25/M40 family metallo-hydrolase [Clostridiales bacterium]|nr:M20/M25/M40 family metallo-hydrolase [Clostridiales bacterium]
MDYGKTIAGLCECHGVAGFEKKIAAHVLECFERFCDEVSIDRLGNVTGFLSCGKKDAKTLMLDAHIDQIGFVVSDILDNGFLAFVPVGGVDGRMLPDTNVLILAEGGISGVISCLPPHILSKEERDKPFDKDLLVIDTGLSKEQAKERIPIGTPVVFDYKAMNLYNDFVSAPALDDRAGVLAILSVIERLSKVKRNVNIIVLGSVMEEKNAHGAITGTYSNRPDFAIVVDATHAKTPDAPANETFPAGSGVMIGMGPNLNRNFTKELIRIAKEKNIPHDFEVMEGSTGTNAWAMQIVADGIPCALVSIPLKYMHTPVETVKMSDIKAVSDLIYEFVISCDGGALCWNY